jgi:hypothetical protein
LISCAFLQLGTAARTVSRHPRGAQEINHLAGAVAPLILFKPKGPKGFFLNEVFSAGIVLLVVTMGGP